MNLILIGGGTASGKTTFAKSLANDIKKETTVSLIEMDNYYFEEQTLKAMGIDIINWDHPNSINWKQLNEDIEELLAGNTVKKPKFDHKSNAYLGSVTIKPGKVIIVEGIFALYDKELIKKSKRRIYVHTDSDVRLIRRLMRDKSSRFSKDFTDTDFLTAWEQDIKPMHDKYIEPTKKRAHIVINKTLHDIKDSNSSIINLLQNKIK